MKSLMTLLHCVLMDMGTRCGTSTTLDRKTIERRVENEGLSFLTISLSNFGKDFQKSLDQGYVAHDQFAGFARTGGLPRFLGGFLELVFDRASGILIDEPSVDAIRAVRQITLMWAKIAIDCTPERESNAYERYIDCERQVRQADQDFGPDSDRRRDFARLGRLLWADLFSHLDNKIYDGEIQPKHGPGATAEKVSGNQKWNHKQWTSRLEREFPHWELLVPSPVYIDRMREIDLREPWEETPSRVISVPKDAGGPRLIAIEPVCMQYVQQAVLAAIKEEFRVNQNARNFVCFDSQSPNQVLAQKGSQTGTLATLDLSEASDRVSNQHVRVLLANHPNLHGLVDASRTRKADVQGHGVIRLAKFASMGSALCFPFESLVFTTVIFLGIEKALRRRMTTSLIKRHYGQVRVYGDDIIIPVDYVRCVVEELEAFGFRVNTNKSFWTGKFRESCGKDYYNGQDISLVRVRSLIPDSTTNAEQIASTVSLRNQLFHADCHRAVEYLDSCIERLIPFPAVPWSVQRDDSSAGFNPDAPVYSVNTKPGYSVVQSSPVLGKHTYGPCYPDAYDYDTQRPMIKGAVLRAKLPINEIDDYAALMKWFLTRGEHPFEDKDHLQRSGRPDSVRIKIRRAPLF